MNERPAEQQQTRVEQGTIAQRQETAASTEAGFLPDDRMTSMRERWTDLQAGFVDDPQTAVQQAHQLVADLVNELTQTFTRERSELENQWKSGGTANTEDLRVALQRYRSFFNRLLST